MHPPSRLAATVTLALAAALVPAVHAAAAEPPAPQSGAITADAYADWSAERVMQESRRRHEQFPYVYEEQTMVLSDGSGAREVRKCRRFSRIEDDGSFKFLLVFDDPQEIRGVALLAVRNPDGTIERGVYLPAFGGTLKRPAGKDAGHFLGTDFAVDDLTPDALEEYRYVRAEDRMMEDTALFVIDAYPVSAEVERATGYGLRRHLLRKDNFVIIQTDFFDRRLRFRKRITHHDIRRVNGTSWRANMIVVNDERERHRTLLKVDRRVYSRDYVPAEIFEPAFLLANGHMRGLDDRVAGRTVGRAPAPRGNDDGS
jgi:hypothetical protein